MKTIKNSREIEEIDSFDEQFAGKILQRPFQMENMLTKGTKSKNQRKWEEEGGCGLKEEE